MSPFIIASALLLSVVSASAIKPQDLVGSWKGRHQETENGQGISSKATLTGTKLKSGAIRLSEKGISYPYRAVHTFKKNGKFTTETVVNGFMVVSSYSGTWKLKNGSISISARGTDGKLSGTLSETSGGFRFTGTTSSLKVVVNATR